MIRCRPLVESVLNLAGSWLGQNAATHAVVQAAPAQETTDYASWPVKELRRFLQERGHDVTGTVEKADLVAQAAAAEEPEGGPAVAPTGFQLDPASGYYSNPDTGMYWDSKSGGFCDSSSGRWYTFDGQQYVEWPTTETAS